MSTFPAKILVATDGSEDAALAVQAAVDLSNETGADLHVVHVGESLPVYPPPASGPPPPSPSREEIHRVPAACSTRSSNWSGRWAARWKKPTCGWDVPPRRSYASAKR